MTNPSAEDVIAKLVRWKLEYDGPPGDRYARHVEDPNGGWVAWPHVEQALAALVERVSRQPQELKAVIAEMDQALQLGALWNPEAFDAKDAILRWRDALQTASSRPREPLPADDHRGLSIDMLDVDRLREWARLLLVHGADITHWGSVPHVAGKMQTLATNIEKAVRDIGSLRAASVSHQQEPYTYGDQLLRRCEPGTRKGHFFIEGAPKCQCGSVDAPIAPVVVNSQQEPPSTELEMTRARLKGWEDFYLPQSTADARQQDQEQAPK